MPRVELSHPADWEGFRATARALAQAGTPGGHIRWAVAGEAAPALAFETPASKAAPAAHSLSVPRWFLALGPQVAMHADPGRFDLLYRILLRLQGEPALRDDALDPDRLAAEAMARVVRREMHKMKAFVRFREVARGPDAPPLHVAWFEPAHAVVDAVAPFFMRRFAGMPWTLLTPARSVRWDGEQLQFGPGARREDAPAPDAGETLWLTYYEHIFNPARLKVAAMEREMPRRYWTNLPEAVLITRLTTEATRRAGGMLAAEPTVMTKRMPQAATRLRRAGPIDATGPGFAGSPAAIVGVDAGQALRQAATLAARCREGPIGAMGTQTVWGEGPLGAALMFVGEQPGDQEDLAQASTRSTAPQPAAE